MALFITLGLINRPSAKMLSLAQHPEYAQHLSVYAVSCTVFSHKKQFKPCKWDFYYYNKIVDIDILNLETGYYKKCHDFDHVV